MPMDKKRYPPDWKAISLRIREKAGWKCEKCGAADRTLIMRSAKRPEHYIVLDADGCFRTVEGDLLRMSELPSEFDESQLTLVVLSVHHKGVDKPDGTPGDRRDKMDCRDENLVALCSRCHLLADMDLNIPARKVTRIRKKKQRIREQGQLELWKE